MTDTTVACTRSDPHGPETFGSQRLGAFVWYELMTHDQPAAERFYRAVIGWNCADAGMPHMKYTLCDVGGRPVAGMMDIPADAQGLQPLWIGYVAVANTDMVTAEWKASGGSVHHAPTDIPGVGRFAVLGDPQGPVIAVIRGSMENPPPLPPAGTPGFGGWHELFTTDREAALAFYTERFGWSKEQGFDMGAMGVYQLFGRNGELLGGMMTKPPQMPHPMWLHYFNVDGIEAAKGRVETAGGTVLMGPTEVPGGQWILQCRDPQGAMFALLGPR